MLQNFTTVGFQVAVMLLLMGLGFLCRKVKFLGDQSVKDLSDVMLYIVTPCVVLKAFDRPFEGELLRGFLIAAAAAVGAHLLSFALGRLFFRGGEESRRKVLRFALIFVNSGFFSIPVLEAVLGDEGVFYGAAYLGVFNLLVWTYGLWDMSRGSAEVSAIKILTHPGILCVAVGLVLFFTPVSLPGILAKPVELLAGLNTPVPMLIIGYYIAGIDRKTALRRADEWLLYFLRLVAVPAIDMGVLFLLGVRGPLLTAATISAAAPCATICTMFCAKYGSEEESCFSAQTVAVSTLLSAITITGLTSLAMWLSNLP